MYFRVLNEAGRRERWTVKVQAGTLLESCDSRIRYHKSRVVFWTSEMAAAEKDLRENGIKLGTFEPPAHSNQMRTRMGAELDPRLAARVQECEQRLKSNQDSVNRFTAFKALFRIAGEDMLELNADDVLYFNLENADVGSDGSGEES